MSAPNGDERRENIDGRARIEQLEARYHRVASLLLVGMAVLGATLLICVAFLVYGIRENHAANRATRKVLGRADRERVERINESCRINETKQHGDIMALRRTYAYLSHLTAAERRQRLNVAIIATLPVLEHDARTDDAPGYCDRPGAAAEHLWKVSGHKRGKPPVGLPEPDLKVPKRPAGL